MSCFVTCLDVCLARIIVKNSYHLKTQHVMSKIQTLPEIWSMEGMFTHPKRSFVTYPKGVKDGINGLSSMFPLYHNSLINLQFKSVKWF